MSKLSSVAGKALIKALKRAGFEEIRIKGSHHFLKHPDGRCTVIPVHSGETIGKGLMSQILKDCEISREDLQRLLSMN
jgi:predicted RNA binding protein YcfA (HicA-like mRNA interferase family)